MRGCLVTLEGMDGAGKFTHVALLAKALEDMGYEVVLTREPGGCPLAEAIRELLLSTAYSGMSPRAEALLYAAARAEHVEQVIRPALERGAVVICDRFIDSSLAYQGYARGLGEEAVMQANRLALDGLMPDVTLYLRLAESDAHGRQDT
nr:dTMP kinase [bacterium]